MLRTATSLRFTFTYNMNMRNVITVDGTRHGIGKQANELKFFAFSERGLGDSLPESRDSFTAAVRTRTPDGYFDPVAVSVAEHLYGLTIPRETVNHRVVAQFIHEKFGTETELRAEPKNPERIGYQLPDKRNIITFTRK